MDLITVATSGDLVVDGFKYVLTLLDCFTKDCWVFALQSKKAKEVAKCVHKVFMQPGAYELMHTDNGGEFCPKDTLMIALRERFNFTWIKGAPRHPQSQGQNERFNQTFKKML